jgi:hypothetical protein
VVASPSTTGLALNGQIITPTANNGIRLFDYYKDSSATNITSTSTREKFITSGGSPVFLGANGELPDGNVPQLFFSGNFNNWLTNKGTINTTLTPGTVSSFEKSNIKPT